MRLKKLFCLYFVLLSLVLSSCDKETSSSFATSEIITPEEILSEDTREGSEEESLYSPVKPSEYATFQNSIVVADIDGAFRDPFVLLHDGKYYIYGTGWKCAVSEDLNQPFSEPAICVEEPEDCDGQKWAPEVYKYEYNGVERFYMFTTYRSKSRTITLNGEAHNARGCAVFVADSPEGPFKLHSDGHITPDTWDAIDGTLYIDNEGQPWMVFVHEWTSTHNSIGTMACAKLSEDLTHLVSEPIELFNARSASWATSGVTDGCFVYKTEDGQLLMLWSNWDAYGYCVGIAKSESGNILGPWVQESRPLYSKSFAEEYDGGHGMIFKDKSGKLWLSLHSPNNMDAGRVETPVFIPVEEYKNLLRWDLSNIRKFNG